MAARDLRLQDQRLVFGRRHQRVAKALLAERGLAVVPEDQDVIRHSMYFHESAPVQQVAESIVAIKGPYA